MGFWANANTGSRPSFSYCFSCLGWGFSKTNPERNYITWGRQKLKAKTRERKIKHRRTSTLLLLNRRCSKQIASICLLQLFVSTICRNTLYSISTVDRQNPVQLRLFQFKMRFFRILPKNNNSTESSLHRPADRETVPCRLPDSLFLSL